MKYLLLGIVEYQEVCNFVKTNNQKKEIMGTRSTVKFYSDYDQKTPILSVYQQFDGYISGVGHTLARWLQGKTIINGIQSQTMEDGFANGMGCLSAQYVRDQKEAIGGFYLTTPDDKQEYNYEVRLIDGRFEITVDEFKGTPEELLTYEESDEDE